MVSTMNKNKNNNVKIYNRLFFKLYINYAIMLLVTAILICLIFMKLYEDTTMDNHREQLQRQATTISSKMTEFIYYQKYDKFFEYHSILQEINEMDIWTIANPYADNPMDERMETTSYEEIIHLEDYLELVNSAFQNKIEVRNDYDKIYEVQMINMAVPIYGLNQEVVGALLLMSKVAEQKDIIYNSLYLIITSSLIALAISFIIVILFATELALPISKMRVTALKLARGDYNCKTGISRNDEIGDLSKAIDILSEKLLENDIERKRLEQMRQDFFANVSHELRTPITVIRAYTETLVDGVVQEEEKRVQYYDRMLSECQSMERLVGDLLLLSKMQNPDFMVDREPVNLVQVFDDVIRSASAIAAKKHIKIIVDKCDERLMISGDYDRLRQMFMVILDNAIKFSDENTRVHIKFTKEDKIKVSIQDEGIGIEPEDLDYIFEKFYKSSLRKNASGTGLGLAIAKQIALKHDGTVDVKSTPNVGTTFNFSFPILDIDY